MVENCQKCIEHRTQKAETLKLSYLLGRPWEVLGIDIMELKQKQYLVIQDYYSRFLEVVTLDKTTSKAVIVKMKNIFARHGIPQMSNGEAEKAVDIAKRILSKSEDPNLGLLSYRCTPLESIAVQDFRHKDLALKRENRRIYYRKRNVKDMPILKVGDIVWLTNMSCYEKVQTVAEAPMSYMKKWLAM
ncbi:hypothetical protein PR048_016357 [Dryococelus australis]|uniref:Uncharacterized protein n=1 Tax=Dryococelus australis TaxID=614101 RepID=A0ABQ9HJZ0_9NEOP|nr:hypothetical protein PR048_016357 [Dryococelus australis]